MDTQPLITIGIPTRNRVGYLQEALESATGQTYSNIEIVVSNNVSNDNTQGYLDGILDSRVKIFHQKEMLNMIDNWNFCLQKSSGKYFILLSDDDTLEPDAIESVLTSFRLIDFMGSVAAFGCSVINETGLQIKEVTYSNRVLSNTNILSKYLFDSFRVTMCSTVYSTDSLLKIGGYSPKHILAADTFAWLSCVFRYGNIHFFSENIANYRVHSQMTTKKSLTSLWIREYTNLVVSLQHEIDFSEKVLAFFGLCFVVSKQLLKWVFDVFRIR